MKSGKQPVQYITDRKGKQATEDRKGDFWKSISIFILFIVKVFPNFHIVLSAERILFITYCI